MSAPPVMVAMSGGVDSSVAAALLLGEGREVVGVTLRLWGGESDSGCCAVSDVDDAWVQSAMLMASLPAATNVFVIAQQYQVWVERATATVLVTTVLSVATVTLLLYLLSTGYLPISPFG